MLANERITPEDTTRFKGVWRPWVAVSVSSVPGLAIHASRAPDRLVPPAGDNAMASYPEFHRRSIDDRDAFWREQAALIDWETPFGPVCDYSRPPFAKWFVGGRTNLCHNAVDRHAAMTSGTTASHPAR